MAHCKIFCVFGALLVLACVTSIKADAPNPVEFMAQVGKGVEALGKNTICVAEHGEDAEILAKAYKAFDKTVAGVKSRVDGPLSEEKFADLIKVIVIDTSADMHVVDPQCADVSSYCPSKAIPKQAKVLAELGKALQTMGATLGCLVADPKPEVLGQIPVILGAAIQKVAKNDGVSTTSVGILLPEIITIASELQKLSTSCRSALKSC